MDREDLAFAYLDTLPFEPYPFQEEAVLAWFEAEQGVLVCAPTGMGKTLIAEAGIFEAMKTGKKRITRRRSSPFVNKNTAKFPAKRVSPFESSFNRYSGADFPFKTPEYRPN